MARASTTVTKETKTSILFDESEVKKALMLYAVQLGHMPDTMLSRGALIRMDEGDTPITSFSELRLTWTDTEHS
jgi:hypothetical protein